MTDIWVVVLLAIVGAGVLGAITWGVGSEIWAGHLRHRSDEAERRRREEYEKAHPPIPIQHYVPPEGEPVPPTPPKGYGPWQICHVNWGMGESWDVTRAANDLTHVQTHSRWDTERGAEVALAEAVRTSEPATAPPKGALSVSADEKVRCVRCGGPGRYVFSNAVDVYDTDGIWEHAEATDHHFVPSKEAET